MIQFPTDLYLILDPSVIPHRDILEVAQEAVFGGVRMIQYRDEKSPRKSAYRIASSLLEIIREADGVLIINNDLDLALAIEADGVHLGQDDMPINNARRILGANRIIGGSVHTLNQAVVAQEAGADYLGIGPIFPSSTKQARPPMGIEILKDFRSNVRIPIFAIGGISQKNMKPLFSNGADGVACASVILKHPDIQMETKKILLGIHRIKQTLVGRRVT